MDASPGWWTSFLDFWHQLREGTRDNIIGGLIVAVVLGVLTIFRKAILAGLRRIAGAAPPPAPPPQELKIKVEIPPPILPPQLPEPPLPSEPAAVVAPTPAIPRPPVIGFVARREANGRDIVERLEEELAPHKNQLVTLSGPGGVGKTTLAAEAVRLLREALSIFEKPRSPFAKTARQVLGILERKSS